MTCLDYGDRVAAAGGAEFDLGGRGVRQGRPELGDDPCQQRLERVRDEVEMRSGPQRLVVARRSAQWLRTAHRQPPCTRP